MMGAWRSCPHCGARLPEEASFCPRCAQGINARREIASPRRIPRRALYGSLAVLAVLALILAAWLHTRPRVYASRLDSACSGYRQGWPLTLAQRGQTRQPPAPSRRYRRMSSSASFWRMEAIRRFISPPAASIPSKS